MDGVKFFVGEVISGKLSNGAAVDVGSAVLDPAHFGEIGRIIVLEAFVKSELATELLEFFP